MQRNTIGTRLTVGFERATISLVDRIAGALDSTESDVIHLAVVAMLDSFDSANHTAGASLPEPLTRPVDGSCSVPDFDPWTTAAAHDHRQRQISLANAYIDAPTSKRLASFCDSARMSKARAIRTAVDRYLFNQIISASFGIPQDHRWMPSAH